MNFKILLFSIVTLLSLYSCNKLTDDILVVGDQETESTVKVYKIDTLTVKYSTYKFDSLVTSNASRMLIGQYNDAVFGKIKASTFFELLPASYSITDGGTYDSICMVLKYDDYYVNDTLQPMTFHVKRISETVKPEDDYFYTTSSLNTYSGELGSKTFKPRPLFEKDTLLIRLSDTFGNDLFSKIQDNDINNDDEFVDYLKGLKIEPDAADNGSIIGFSNGSSSSYLRIYYSTNDSGERKTNYFDFRINMGNTPAKFFNQIISDRSGTELESLSNQNITLSDINANRQAFVQSGIGIVTRIEFPYLKDIYNIENNVAVLDAKLYLNPKLGTYNDHLPLPESYELYKVDKKNYLSSQMYDPSGNKLKAELNTENSEFNDVYYTIDLGIYIEGLLQTSYNDGSAFIIKPADLNSTVDRMVINTKNSGEIKSYLELTIVSYE